jgi:hypothetical protein
MKRTAYQTVQTGLLTGSDLVRARPGSRSIRPVVLPEPVIEIDVGDPRDAVDAGWRTWNPDRSRAA